MKNQKKRVLHYIKLLDGMRYTDERRVENITFCRTGYKKGNTPPPLSDFVPYTQGSDWGSGIDSHAWFHFTFRKPADMKNTPCELTVGTDLSLWGNTNAQYMIYVDGEMRQGMDANHPSYRFDDEEEHDIYLYAYTGPRAPSCALFLTVRAWHEDIDGLYFDLSVPAEMLAYLPEYSSEYANLLLHLDKAVSLLDMYETGSEAFHASASRARAYLKDAFYGGYCKEQSATVLCIGHTHIDCAWKWTLEQTREKVQRSFAIVLALMERYPEYRFMSSQALLYKYLKEENPALYAKVKERIKEGRWECEGAMWVEADCNLSSGESLVRQVMYGKRFFEKEFGVKQHILWLPDVFGYSAALPQILRKCGVDWFVTSKISWNDTNQMPNDTFSWQGIDGTRINTYFLTAQKKTLSGPVRYTTYNGNPTVPEIAGTWDRYQNKNLNSEVLHTFGWGDGGGGPTREMLEYIRRESAGLPGAPNARIGFAGEFLSRLEQKIKNNPLLPTWRGELYLEFHRGTYTSLAKNKRNNRKSEFAYENAEFYSILAKRLASVPYPKAALAEGWEMILTNQFHDIIPGSSIREVYEQSDKDYAAAFAIGDAATQGAVSAIASRISADEGYVILNPHTVTDRGYTRIDGKCAYVEGIPQKGYSCIKAPVLTNRVKIDGKRVETDRLAITFDEYWQIASVYDKRACRELLSEGGVGNELRVYADYPDNYDAWEWQAYSRGEYRTLREVSEVSVVEDGARAGIRITRPYRSSAVVQTVWFYDGTPRIDFDTVCDWHEKHQMLKAAFHVDINADRATYDVQFGSVERPTHFNTSWDSARFEVCAHKYADLSDGGYGVALLNDCKYGYDIHEGVMQLSLLRCPAFPYEEADEGEMRCTYALLLHEGGVLGSDVIATAYALNNPFLAVKATGKASTLPTSYSLVSVSDPRIVCETVKEAEDGEEIILRLYESQNKKGSVTLTLAEGISECILTDMMENELSSLSVENGRVTVPFDGFEIVTLKLR